LILSRDSLS